MRSSSPTPDLILPPIPFAADDTPSGPRDLVLSEPSSQSLRVQWTAASGPVTGYKVQYTPLTELGQPLPSERQEVRMPAVTGGCPGLDWTV